jgi:hypothetical protein
MHPATFQGKQYVSAYNTYNNMRMQLAMINVTSMYTSAFGEFTVLTACDTRDRNSQHVMMPAEGADSCTEMFYSC